MACANINDIGYIYIDVENINYDFVTLKFFLLNKDTKMYSRCKLLEGFI